MVKELIKKLSDETKYIDLEENKDELKSIEEDTIQENFETSEKVVEENKDKAKLKRKLLTHKTELTKLLLKQKIFKDVNLWLCNMLNS